MFTENQVRQFYVVNSVVTGDVTNQSDAGATKLKEGVDKKEFYFLHKGASEDGLQRSDLIGKCNIMDIRATAAEDMEHKMRKYEVTLDESVNEGKPVVGQDYVLNVEIKNYIANGDDSTRVKFGAARAKNEVASDLYKAIAMNVAKNFAREQVNLVKVTLKGSDTEITSKTKAEDLAEVTATGIVIEEVEQPWRRGVARVEYVNFALYPSTIYTGGLDVVWGKVKDVTQENTNTLPNSKLVADMEWFYHKERGDIYGQAGYPQNIDTTYMIDPTNADGYSFLDIHFYFDANSMNVGHSEKTCTLVGKKADLQKIVTSLETMLEKYNVTIQKSKSWAGA